MQCKIKISYYKSLLEDPAQPVPGLLQRLLASHIQKRIQSYDALARDYNLLCEISQLEY